MRLALPAAPATPPCPRAGGGRARFTLTREGDYWAVTDASVTVRIRDARGMQMLAELIAAPRRDVHALALMGADGDGADGGDAGELLDKEAIAEYRARLRALEDDLSEAESWNDAGRAARARAERDAIAAELARGVGLGGRGRRASRRRRAGARQRSTPHPRRDQDDWPEPARPGRPTWKGPSRPAPSAATSLSEELRMKSAIKERTSGTSVALRVAAGAPVPPDVADRLRAGGRALELDCGGGLGCLALAEAFPAAHVVGHDQNPAEIVRARSLARASGLEGRVTFAVAGSARLDRASFDLAAARAVSTRDDALQVLNAIRNALTPEGVCLLVEPTHGVTDTPLLAAGAGRGAHARAEALAALAQRAGFGRCELSCREPAFDVYELRR